MMTPGLEKETVGAGNGIRTRDFQLGKLTLYQLSYARPSGNVLYHRVSNLCKAVCISTPGR